MLFGVVSTGWNWFAPTFVGGMGDGRRRSCGSGGSMMGALVRVGTFAI